MIDQDGLEITNYQKNPIVLFSHDPTLWIGQTKQLFHEKGCNVNRWLADVQFASNALGDECEQGAAAGILVATSIGFNPLAEPRKLSGQPSATQAPGQPQDSFNDGFYWPRTELVEWSVVTTPANLEALGAREKVSEQRDNLRTAALHTVERMEAVGLRVPVLRAFALGRDYTELLRRRSYPGVTLPQSATVTTAYRTLEAGDLGAGGATVGSSTPASGSGPAETESAKPEHEDGVMVALMVPADVAKKIAVPGGEKPEDLHCTLAYLGKAGELGADKIRKAGEIVRSVASEHPALTGAIVGTARLSGDGHDVATAIAHLPSLPSLHDAVHKAFADAEITSRSPGHLAHHVALANIEPTANSPASHIDPVAMKMHHLTLMVGEQTRAHFPLGGTKRADAASPSRRVDLLERIAVEVSELRSALLTARSSDVVHGVVPYDKTPCAPIDTPWDGDGARDRLAKWAGGPDKDKIDWKKYARGFAYVEPDGTAFGDYLLPHHDVIDGKLVVVWKGVVAAMSALLVGRGGTSIPTADLETHLVKLFEEREEAKKDHETLQDVLRRVEALEAHRPPAA